jgi:hypothetical protein
MKDVKLQITKELYLPFIDVQFDYHDFEETEKYCKNFDVNIKWKELGCTGMDYYAIFYLDENKLTVNDVKKFLETAGVTSENIKELTTNLKL